MIYLFLILFLIYIILGYRTLRYLNKEEKLSIKKLHRKYKLFRYLQYLLVAIIFVFLTRFEIIIINNLITFTGVIIILISLRQSIKIHHDLRKLNLPKEYINERKILEVFGYVITVGLLITSYLYSDVIISL